MHARDSGAGRDATGVPRRFTAGASPGDPARTPGRRSRSGTPGRTRGGGPSPGSLRSQASPGRQRGSAPAGRTLLFSGGSDGDGDGAGRIAAATWRLSLCVGASRRTRRVLRAHPSKNCGQLPLIAGLEVFTLRSLGLTSLRGMGVHPEVRQLFAQSNLLTSFEGFEPQDNLVELHVEDNLIESFRSAPPPFSRAAPARPPAHPPAPP
jgi:hypothetical protein